MTLNQLFERKPLVLIRLPEKFGDAYRCSRYGLAKFTLTKPHGALEGMKLPALCLIEMQDKEKPMCYVGIARLKKPIATLESVYLRESDLLDLIQSGYVGTHGRETEAITPLIQAVAKGNRGVVIAWQHLLKKLPIP